MKLYKDGKCMQHVDKDQLEICLDAGWSKIDEVAVQEAEEEALAEIEADEKRAFAIVNAKIKKDKESEESGEEIANDTPKRVVKIKTTKKK